jgi:HlyD family secretion protein
VVAVENPEQILLPGMTAYVSIVVAQKNAVLLVPNTALRFKPAETDKVEKADGEAAKSANGSRPSVQPGATGEKRRRDSGSSTVYVLASGKIKQVKVGTGITDSRFTEVAGGELKEGDKVITGENLPNSATPASSSTFRLRMF